MNREVPSLRGTAVRTSFTLLAFLAPIARAFGGPLPIGFLDFVLTVAAAAVPGLVYLYVGGRRCTRSPRPIPKPEWASLALAALGFVAGSSFLGLLGNLTVWAWSWRADLVFVGASVVAASVAYLVARSAFAWAGILLSIGLNWTAFFSSYVVLLQDRPMGCMVIACAPAADWAGFLDVGRIGNLGLAFAGWFCVWSASEFLEVTMPAGAERLGE